MPAPQALKAALVELLDEAYETDTIAIRRVEVTADTFVSYDENALETQPALKEYKVTVDASDAETIRIRIRPVGAPLLWPF